MYALHRLTTDSQNFISSFVGSSRSRSDSFSMAAAFVLANSVDLSKENGRDFFGETNRKAILAKLSSLNEILRINSDKILDYGRKLLAFRQFQYEGGNVISAAPGSDMVNEIFGISRFFSQEDIEVIRSSGASLPRDIVMITEILKQMGVLDVQS